MTKARYNALMRDDSVDLTPEEIEAGWHFCYEWDGLLVGPGMGERDHCTDYCNVIPKREVQSLSPPASTERGAT